MSNQVSQGTSAVQEQAKTNQFVTISHILLIAIYSILSILFFNVDSISSLPKNMIITAWTFFGGLSDLFIMSMIWYVFDDKSTPDVFRHGDYSYSVVNVINEHASLNNDVEIEEYKEEE